MSSNIKCVFCATSTAELPAADSVRVRSSVREFGAETFTVWRCAKCGSLHALEPIDYERYYRYYWLKSMKCNFGAKVMLRKRLGVLKHAGLERGATLLDYGCGSGHFVRYAREHGIQAEGYDPYSPEFNDASVLDGLYDFVTAQDVLEHVDDPRTLVDDLRNSVAAGGNIAISTPNADAIDLHDALYHVGPLHQPFHRHIPSTATLLEMASAGGWPVVVFRRDSSADTRVPFINTAFIWRYLKSSEGFLDAGCDPVTHHIRVLLSHPSLIFWGLFGGLCSRGTYIEVVTRAPLNVNTGHR